MPNITESVCIRRIESGKLNEEDRLDLCRILAKAGYIVSVERRRTDKSTYEYVVVGYTKEVGR